MEVEDLTMQVINFETKIMKSEEALLEAKNELFQATCTVKQAESKLKHAEERVDELKAENLDVCIFPNLNRSNQNLLLSKLKIQSIKKNLLKYLLSITFRWKAIKKKSTCSLL